jgi:hypothetical protein
MSIYIAKSRGHYYLECQAYDYHYVESIYTIPKKEDALVQIFPSAKGKVIVVGYGLALFIQQAIFIFKKIITKKTAFSVPLVVNTFFPKFEEMVKSYGATLEELNVCLYVIADGLVYYISPSDHVCRSQEEAAVNLYCVSLARTIKDANGHEGFALMDDVFDILINRESAVSYPLLRVSTENFVLQYKMDAGSSWERVE